MSTSGEDDDTEKQDWLNALNDTAEVLERLTEQVKEREQNNPDQSGYLDRIQRTIGSLRTIHAWLQRQPSN